MDWIQNNPETTATAVFGVLALAVALWIAFWQNKPKRLDYEIRNNVPILSSHASSLGGRLSILFEGKGVTEPRLVTVRIKNTGKLAVTADEYVDPIRVDYERNPPFDGFVAQESTPGILTDVFDGALPKRPAMVPELLNPGDWFDVQLLSDGEPGTISVSSRFKNQSRKMRVISDGIGTRQMIALAAASALWAFMLAWVIPTLTRGWGISAYFFGVVFSTLVALTILRELVANRNRRDLDK
jgi:hypothetical protein